MDKETEIKTLQSLKGDTYFAQFFKSCDIDQMCENIKNDFPIELNCQFDQKASQLERINADLKKEYEGIKHNWGMSFTRLWTMAVMRKTSTSSCRTNSE